MKLVIITLITLLLIAGCASEIPSEAPEKGVEAPEAPKGEVKEQVIEKTAEGTTAPRPQLQAGAAATENSRHARHRLGQRCASGDRRPRG